MPPNTEDSPMSEAYHHETRHIVVIGLGMVAVSFIEKVLSYDTDRTYHISVFSEENQVAYNRVGLTQYFGHRSVEQQLMQPRSWYDEHGISLYLGDPVLEIDVRNQRVRSNQAGWLTYDVCVLATGSSAAYPPNVTINPAQGVFVYRTLEDLDGMIRWTAEQRVQQAAVVGGGLLGLEAAKAAKDLGIPDVVIYERSDRLMARQLDTEASDVLVSEIEKLGLKARIGDCPTELVYQPNGPVSAARVLSSNECEPIQMVIYAIGIRPRDSLAMTNDFIATAPRGGFVVDEQLKTSADNVFAIGECASFKDFTYGLVAPGYDMAEVAARNLTTRKRQARKAAFKGADMSTKLKLLGVQVASFGDPFADDTKHQPLVYRDPFSGIYKKYIFTKDGKKLVGGIQVGDTHDYAKLLSLVRAAKRLQSPPSELILGVQEPTDGNADALPDDTQICSCNNVTKGDIRSVIRDKQCENLNQVKCFSKAGTGCGGCLPQVQEIFEVELKSLGQKVSNSLCAHFKYSRAELFTIGKVKQLKTFQDYSHHAATQGSCEVCKPAIASILASLWNEHILNPGLAPLQDTNDRYLANIQRGGLYSIVPRIPAGEITPHKLAVIASVAEEYGLYTKITGAQRVDLMGAHKEDLPQIWEKLVEAGFESGHAYGKSLRAVKSCVGTSWCRYGQQDSVGFAITLENRYKGIRSPHKLKGGVSGCIRECAEAQGKDFGCIATDKGYNVYVCGNGGSKPKHAELLVADVSEELAIKYLDRFLMYYIMTADRLTRTARWLEKLEGGIQYLRKVVIEDELKIADELEAHMQQLIGTYQCEWTTVVRDPTRRKHFETPFVNERDDTEERGLARRSPTLIDMVSERGQLRPADWPKEVPPMPQVAMDVEEVEGEAVSVGHERMFPVDEGRVVRVGDDIQIAIFRTEKQWYATQNMCPHKRALVLASGILGSADQQPYVSCPMHKKNFDLGSGQCLVPGEEEKYRLATFKVHVDAEGQVYLTLPPMHVLNDALSAKQTVIRHSMVASSCSAQSAGGGGGCGNKSLEW